MLADLNLLLIAVFRTADALLPEIAMRESERAIVLRSSGLAVSSEIGPSGA